jgi:hypothetical protein
MKLIELDPHFLRRVVTPNWPTEIVNDPAVGSASGSHTELREQVVMHPVDSIAEAQGIQFLCPKCFAANGGPVGTHLVVCWSRSRGTPEDARPGPGRWSISGTSLDDLTLNGDAVGGGGNRSVLLIGGCAWHGFITGGEVTSA